MDVFDSISSVGMDVGVTTGSVGMDVGVTTGSVDMDVVVTTGSVGIHVVDVASHTIPVNLHGTNVVGSLNRQGDMNTPVGLA